MPLTKKGTEVMRAMKAEYGAAKGEQVFYATRNAGKLTGVERSGGAGASKSPASGGRGGGGRSGGRK